MKTVFDFVIITNLVFAMGNHIVFHQTIEAIYFLVFALLFATLRQQVEK